ncbi:uncharacterized protein LOC128234061 isoform X2 [Mya arenaria]|uniref:uncharacterized protein LOC128234061 isoform X2 n=1 Tax=Mya arenaria TaxID=6604 RepID=UPI0022E32473|nr:uncharacterized protein LOC128234061 isoform X2 [Mya arenaria]
MILFQSWCWYCPNPLKGVRLFWAATCYVKIVLTITVYIPGILCIQGSKFASLGGQQILDCDLRFPDGKEVTYMVDWKKDGLDKSVLVKFDGYAANVHPQFEERVRLVNGISLEISHIQESDEGWFECNVIYLNGIDNKEANGTWIYLNVYIPPKLISSSPQSFHQPLGSSARIYCKAGGNPPPRAWWTKDDHPIQLSSRVTLEKGGSEIIITDLQKRDGGIYKCTFNNTVGLIAQSIHLIVEGQAYIIGHPSNKTAVLGQRIQFKCEARGYPTNITYRWYKDERNVNMLQGFGSRLLVQTDGSLVITTVEKEDMGWYQCRPTNGIGQDPEAVAFLNVTYQPEVLIDQMPRSVIWALGFKERLDCPVDANPLVHETVWTRNGIVINHQSNLRLSLLRNGSLLVDPVMMSYSGNYRCTAISTIGTGDSQIVQVEVRDPPRFTVRPDSQYILQLDQSVTLPCVVMGTPLPTISWRRVLGSILLGGRIQQNGGNLTINALEKSDHGVYECEARNEVRTIVTSTEIVIQTTSPKGPDTTPHAPYNISVETQLFAATVRWIPAYSSSLQYFKIWYRPVVNGIPGKWSTFRVEPQNATRFTLYGLEPDTLYEFKVLAINDLGEGNFSSTVHAKTLAKDNQSTLSGYLDGNPNVAPTDETGHTYFPPIVSSTGDKPSKPVNVSVTLEQNSIVVTWDQPAISPVTIFYFIVEYNHGVQWTKSGPIKAPDMKFVLSPVEEGVTYSFRVVSYGILAFSIPSEVKNIQVPKAGTSKAGSTINYSTDSDEGFGLSSTEVGGIIGGLLFLVVAVTLAVIAVICSRRKDRRKHQDKYGNVKYAGAKDEMDGRPEYPPEWSEPPPYGGGHHLANKNAGFQGNETGIFVLPKSGQMYNSLQTGDNVLFRDHDRLMYDAELGRSVRNSSYNDSGYPDFVNNVDRNSTINSNRRLVSYDENSRSRDTSSRNTSRNRSRSQPAWRHSDGPKYPVPQRPRGHSLPRDSFQGDPSYSDDTMRYGPQSQVPPRSPQHPAAQTPVFTPVQPHQRSTSHFHGDQTSDEDVFMPPPPPLPPVTRRPAFPRHSSMKPGSQQTYLTDDIDTSGRPFLTSDISSVLPSPFSDSAMRRPYQPYQRQYHDPPYQNLPFNGSSFIGVDNSRDGSYGDNDNTVVARQQSSQYSPERTMTNTLPRGDSSESNGKPYNYTRDQLLGAVDQVRRGKVPMHKGQGHSWGSRSGNSDNSSLNNGHHGAQIPESAKPSVIVRDRPSRSYLNGQEPYKRHSGVNNRNSMNSTGSYVGNGRERSRSLGREDLTPDSLSSGIGSRNTSQLTGSSLHSRPSRLGSGLSAPDMSADSGAHMGYHPAPQRKDISGDENYEFDSYNAVETDLLEALKNYSEVNNGNGELLSALQEGLSATGLMSELYPKPSRQSRYSHSEQRFEKLRGEYQKYRQQQEQDRSVASLRNGGMRGMVNKYPSHRGENDSYTSTTSSRFSGGQPEQGMQYYSRPGELSYKAGPMDSDML